MMDKLLFIIFLLFASCGKEKRDFENYDIKNIPALTLSAQNHPHGWQFAECFYCHTKANIHQEDRLGTGLLPQARSQVQTRGTSSCSSCHGSNGVVP